MSKSTRRGKWVQVSLLAQRRQRSYSERSLKVNVKGGDLNKRLCKSRQHKHRRLDGCMVLFYLQSFMTLAFVPDSSDIRTVLASCWNEVIVTRKNGNIVSLWNVQYDHSSSQSYWWHGPCSAVWRSRSACEAHHRSLQCMAHIHNVFGWLSQTNQMPRERWWSSLLRWYLVGIMCLCHGGIVEAPRALATVCCTDLVKRMGTTHPGWDHWILRATFTCAWKERNLSSQARLNFLKYLTPQATWVCHEFRDVYMKWKNS